MSLSTKTWLPFIANLYLAERELSNKNVPFPSQIIIQKYCTSWLWESSLNRWSLNHSSAWMASKCCVKAHLWSAELSHKNDFQKPSLSSHFSADSPLLRGPQELRNQYKQTYLLTWHWKLLNNGVQSIQHNLSFLLISKPSPQPGQWGCLLPLNSTIILISNLRLLPMPPHWEA